MNDNCYFTVSKESMFIRCDCNDCEHQAIITYDNDPDFSIFYLEFHLRTWHNIFKRLWIAIQYVLGHKSKYGEWDELLINKESAKQIAAFLNRYSEPEPTSFTFTSSDVKTDFTK